MDFKHVLMMDCSEDISLHAPFLLKLAGYRVTVVKDAAEMVNWISNCQDDSNRVDLLLMSNVVWPEEGSVLLDAIMEFSQTLPILVVNRGVSCKRVMKISLENLAGSSFHMCSPDSIIESLADVLASKEGSGKHRPMSA